MRFGLKLSQRANIDELRGVWQIADDEGFDHCWVMDHFATLGDDESGDIFEAWTMLGAMAQLTSHCRIGCMVTGNTYRHPGVLAKIAVTVDHLSGGRLEFGLGAAWAENEHTMLGLELGTVRDRLDRLEEACQLIRALWTQQRTTFAGRHYQLTDAVANPKPVQQPHPPIWIGGSGRRRTLRIAAQYADVWNCANTASAQVAELSAVLDRHCAGVGRDPLAIRRTVQLPWPGDADAARTVEEYAAVGISELVWLVAGDGPVSMAKQVAAALPRLRTVG